MPHHHQPRLLLLCAYVASDGDAPSGERVPLHAVRKLLLVSGVVAALTGIVLAVVIGAPFRSKPSRPAASAKCKNQAATRRERGSGGPSCQERKASRPAAPDLSLSFDADLPTVSGIRFSPASSARTVRWISPRRRNRRRQPSSETTRRATSETGSTRRGSS